MGLQEDIADFEAARDRILPVLQEKRNVIPIFTYSSNRLDEGFFSGDGFFLSGAGRFCYKLGGAGFDAPATPYELWQAFDFFKQDIGNCPALRLATTEINGWYDELVSR